MKYYYGHVPYVQVTKPLAAAPNVVPAVVEAAPMLSLIGVNVEVAVVCIQPTDSVEVALSEVVIQTVPELVNCVVEACPSVVSPVNHATPELEICVVEACWSDVSPVVTVSDPPVVIFVLMVVVACTVATTKNTETTTATITGQNPALLKIEIPFISN